MNDSKISREEEMLQLLEELQKDLEEKESQMQILSSENLKLRSELQEKSEQIVKISNSDLLLASMKHKEEKLQKKERQLQSLEDSIDSQATNLDRQKANFEQKVQDKALEIIKCENKRLQALYKRSVKDAKSKYERAIAKVHSMLLFAILYGILVTTFQIEDNEKAKYDFIVIVKGATYLINGIGQVYLREFEYIDFLGWNYVGTMIGKVIAGIMTSLFVMIIITWMIKRVVNIYRKYLWNIRSMYVLFMSFATGLFLSKYVIAYRFFNTYIFTISIHAIYSIVSIIYFAKATDYN